MKPIALFFILRVSILAFVPVATVHASRVIETDICIYGGAAGGVTAAVQAARMGKSVSLVVVNGHLGGLSSGGLGDTDIGNNGDAYIQGMSREFYTRIAARYGLSGAKFTFEPKVAEAVFNEMIAQAQVPVYLNRYLVSTEMADGKITKITTNTGDIFMAKVFIDASYEGDLMKQAGVSFTSGREANSQYGETINGIQTVTHGNQLPNGISPWVVAGNPASGLLPGVNAAPSGPNGSADSLIQAYCYRMCMTNVAANREMIPQPAGYDEKDYEILFRAIESGQSDRFWKTRAVPNGKTDSNNDSGVSCDYISGTTDSWIDADPATRVQLAKEHENWQRGLVWTVQNHPRVPAAIRSAWSQWGLPKDEFTDNGHWPHQLYIREARRMVSDYVMTEKNCMGTLVAADSIGMGAYTMDSHNCQRIVSNGMVKNEGDIQRAVPGPYPISYRAIVPKAGECKNLLVPWSLSATHISFGSIRMEPVFMILGQSAATAAAFAIDDGVTVQAVSYPKLKAQMLADGQRLTNSGGGESSGIIVDNADATGVLLTGTWTAASATPGFHGVDYVHDGGVKNGSCSARFTPTLPEAGTYEVFLRWTENANRASNVPVEIRLPGGTIHTASVNQRTRGGQWVSMGSFDFAAGASPSEGSVTIRDSGVNGHVIADAVRFLQGIDQPVVDLWATDARAAEPQPGAAKKATLCIRRSEPLTNALTVRYTLGGSAVSGVDYGPLTGSVILPAGIASAALQVVPLADSLAEGTEDLVISLAADPAYRLGELATETISIGDTPFDQWRHSRFSSEQLADPTISGPDADPDKDGTSNLLEFFAGGDPLTVSLPPHLKLYPAPVLALEVERHRSAAELFMRVEESADLVGWAPAGGLPEITGGDPLELLRFSLGELSGPAGFLRLAVSETPFPQ
ncbi:FAD-dependent oxidoreductase [Luteolibacter sp. Populi]|uniref:FAD-dependent oxidoreductase n=1 Tax=Luteolibacter sp. Populi TaxID=3230487 RepID=UPI003465FC9B